MLTSNRPYSTSGLRQVKVIPLFITNTDTIKPWSTPSSNTDILSLLSGDDDLQSQLRTLFTEFLDIFSNDFTKEPANIPPFNLIVDNLKWKVGKNKVPS